MQRLNSVDLSIQTKEQRMQAFGQQKQHEERMRGMNAQQRQ